MNGACRVVARVTARISVLIPVLPNAPTKIQDTMRIPLFARALALFALIFASALPVYAQGNSATIRTLLESRDREVKAVLGNRSSFSDAQKDQLKTLINGVIDFEAMGQEALGSTWATLTPAQRTQFVSTFADVVRNQSLSDLGIYRATVTYGTISVNGNTALARTTTAYKGKSARVDYEMHLKNGQWRITDIVLDDVSTAGSYARQFQQVVRRRGFDALMTTLQKRLERG